MMSRHSQLLGSALLGLALLASVGCGQRTTPVARTTPSVGMARFIDPDTGASLAATTISLDFGPVPLHAPAQRAVRIRNDGTLGLRLQTATPEGLPTSFMYDPDASDLGPGEETSFTTHFRPTVLGEAVGSIRFLAENGDPSALTVELRGTGTCGDSPELEVAPAEIDFGPVAVDTFVVRHLRLTNVGSDVAGTSDDNLHFGVRNDDGSWVEAPAKLSGPDAADFQIVWPPEPYGPDGLASGDAADFAVRFSPTSRGPKSAALEIASNDTYLAAVFVPLSGLAAELPACDFEVRPAALDFGLVAPVASETLAFEIVNRGAGTDHECRIAGLQLTQATLGAGAYTVLDGPFENVGVPAGGSLDVRVRFRPHAAGSYDGAVVFYVSNPAQPEIAVPLSGVAQASCIEVLPTALEFGSVGLSCPTPRNFAIRNNCAGSVEVTAMELRAGTSDEFYFAQPPALPSSLGNGEQLTVSIGYRPRDLGNDSGSLAVTLAGEPFPFVVPLNGSGIEHPSQVDVFSQSDMPKVDLLFVVDNSATMADKQAALESNLAAFIQYAAQDTLYVDFHIAVTTTDVTASGAAGRLLPLTGTNPRVMTRTTQNLQQVFAQAVAVGTSGSESEALLYPAYLALTDPLLTGHNSGFYRDEAKLALVVVSDAVDQDPSAYQLSFYESFFLNLKGTKRRSDFAFAAIVPTQSQAPAGCSYDTPSAGDDTRMKTFAARMGGLIDDICSPDWSLTVNRVVTRAFALRTTFFLSNVPDASTITITVDGAPYDQVDASGAKRWDYDTASNAIVFERTAVPAPGATLSISYQVACF